MVAAMVAIVMAVSAPAMAFAQATETQSGTITVTGAASVRVRADIARLTIGIEIQDADSSVALESLFNRTAAITAALREAGIPESAIETRGHSVWQPNDHPWFEGPDVERFMYLASSSMRITITDVNRVDRIMDIALESGATSIWDVNFSVLDTRAHYLQALERAVRNARGRADVIANAMDVTIIGVESVVEDRWTSFGGDFAPATGAADGAMRMEQEVFFASPREMTGGVTPLEVEITAWVSVTYRIQ